MKAAHLEKKAVSHDLRQACPFCGGDAFRTVLRTYRTTYILSHAYPLEYRYCRVCGPVYSARQLSAAQLDYLYHSGREVAPASFAKGHAWRSPTDRVRAEFLQRILAGQAPHLQGGRLLEIGSGYGAFLKHAQEAGFQTAGIESSPSRAECTRRQVGAEVMTGTFPEASPPDRRFDVVCAFHVIEHIQDPLPFLAQVRAALVEGGALYLETPNILAIQQRQLAESHTILYSPRTLAALVRRAGFRVLYLDGRAKSVFDTDDQLRGIAVREERAGGGAADTGHGALEEIDAEEAVRTAIRKSLQTMYPEGGRVTVVKRMQGLITSGSRWAIILGPLVCIGMLVGCKRAWMEKLVTGLGGAIDPAQPLSRPALARRAYRLLMWENAEIRKNRLYYESLADGVTASHETSACVTR